MSNEPQSNIQTESTKAPKLITRINNFDDNGLFGAPNIADAEECDLLDDRYYFFDQGETEEGMREAGMLDPNETSLDCNELTVSNTSDVTHIEVDSVVNLKSPFGEDNLFCRISENEFMDLEEEKRFIVRFTDKK